MPDLLPESLLSVLRNTYRQPDRHYHGLAHIEDLLTRLKAIRHLAANEDALRFAIWFHDLVYDVTRHDNEEASANAAVNAAFALGCEEAFAGTVRRLILVTVHNPETHPPKSGDEKLMCDLDLASLAVGWDEFQQNTERIRLEYAHVPEEAFRQGRRSILTRFLNRPSIYYTAHFRDRYEAQARANLLRATS